MARIIFYSAKSWATFFESPQRWLTASATPKILVIPADWPHTYIQTRFPQVPIFTLNALLARYLLRKPGHPTLLARQALEQLLLTVIFEDSSAFASTQSRYLNIETYHQGYARALTEFILDFRERGPDNLLTALNTFKGKPLSQKERDLIDIHTELENLLHTQQLFDYRRALLTYLDDKTDGLPAHFLAEYPEATLVIFGFHHFYPLDAKLIGRLMYRFPHTIFACCQNPQAAPATFSCQKSLENFLEKAHQVFTDQCQHLTLAAARKSIFEEMAEILCGDVPPARQLPATAAIQILVANDRFQEMTQIAQKICALRDDGITCDQMRIIVNNYETYTALALEVLPRYQIPYQLIAGVPLAFYPLGQLLLNLLNHAISPTPFALREHIFSAPYIRYCAPVTAQQLLDYIRSTNEELLVYSELITNAIAANAPVFTLNFPELQARQRQASRVMRNTEILTPLVRCVRYLEQLATQSPAKKAPPIFETILQYYLLSQAEKALYVWRADLLPVEFEMGFGKIFRTFQLETNLQALELQSDPFGQAVVQQDQEILRTFRQIVARVVTQFQALASSAEQKFRLSDLARACANLYQEPDHYLQTGDPQGIKIFATDQIGLDYWPVTFLAGLVDGEFPTQEPFNFLQPKSEGKALVHGPAAIEHDRQLLYQICVSTTQTLVLTTPFTDSGKKLLTSPFIQEVQKCFATPLTTPPCHDAPSLRTWREKLIFVGQNIDQAAEQVQPLLTEWQQTAPAFLKHLYSILRCDGLRNSIENFSEFDGIFQSAASQTVIQKQLGGNFIFNSEILERFAGCPMRFLFDNLMHLKPEFLTDYHPDRTDRGLIIRQILIEFTRAVAAAGEIPHDAGAQLIQAAQRTLESNWREKDNLFSDRFRQGLLQGLVTSDTAATQRPGLLAAFLNYERTAPDLLQPVQTDLVFTPTSVGDFAFQLDDIPIAVQIDRVDHTRSGKYALVFNFSIADFGNVPGIGKGLRFQLPLQILALRNQYQQQGRPRMVAGAGIYLVKNYHDVKRGGYFAIKNLQATRADKVTELTPIFSGQRKYGFLPVANFELELAKVVARVKHIRRLIIKGRFHLPLAAVRDQICLNCHFTRICRLEQLRLDQLYTQVNDQETYKPLRRLE